MSMYLYDSCYKPKLRVPFTNHCFTPPYLNKNLYDSTIDSHVKGQLHFILFMINSIVHSRLRKEFSFLGTRDMSLLTPQK